VPFGVAKQIGLGDLYLNNGEASLAVYGHHVGTPGVGKRNFAHRKNVAATEQARNAASHFGGNRRRIGKAI